jgi:hypothetical protein
MDVLALAIFVHLESVALVPLVACMSSKRACTKSLFHRSFCNVEHN